MKKNDIYLSQSSMDMFDLCKLKYKKVYIDKINWDNEEDNFGSDFHLHAQRYYIGMDEVFEDGSKESELMDNLRNFLKRGKNMYPEYTIKYSDQDMQLLAKVDLIRYEKDEIIIYDWKTSEAKLEEKKLINSYQTRIYLHNVADKTKLSPEKIRLVYYNPRKDDAVVINYSKGSHELNKQILKSKVNQIDNEEIYMKNVGKHCKYCKFNALCNNEWVNLEAIL